MHHIIPSSKGDPLCPLGFHPQVRWPTRCKRCFRDYKEHGYRKDQDALKRDETTVSSPSLSTWNSVSSRSRDGNRSDSSSSTNSGVSTRNWSSGGSSGSRGEDNSKYGSSGTLTSRFSSGRPAASWTSTPDLGNLNDDTRADITTVSLTLPRRRRVPQVDTGQDSPEPVVSDSFTLRHHQTPLSTAENEKNSTSTSSAAAASHTTTQPTKQTRSSRRSMSQSSTGTSGENKDVGKLRRLRIQSLKEVHSVEEPTNPEVEFIIQVKSSKGKSSSSKTKNASGNGANSISSSTDVKKTSGTLSLQGSSSSGSSGSSGTSEEEGDSDDDQSSVAGTETTETTLVDNNENELQEQIDSLKQELETMRARCERVEREKSDILLRRIAALDTAPSKTAASEVLKLQQKVNELQSQTEDLRDDKKSLNLRVKELEEELGNRPDKMATQRTVDEMHTKLLAAETLCEELMDENEDMKKELRDLEEEIEEMQDNFREDQADEYTSLKKELEQTNKNCRILSFKLRKAERKTEQLDAEKLEVERKFKEVAGGQTGLEKVERIKQLEQELAVANEVAVRLQKELDETNAKLKAKEEASNKETTKKKAPMLGTIGKVSSGEKVSRASLTRGGSQEDPQQLLRDLQDSLEREADLREQLRFAEEELQRNKKQRIIIRDNSADWRNTPALPSLRPDVVPSLYQQEISSAGISKCQFQHTTTQLYHEGNWKTPGISSETQTSFLDIPTTSQLRPVILQSQIDTQISPLTSEEILKTSADTQTIQAADFVSTEDKGTDFDADLSQVTNTVQITESTQTDSSMQVSMEIQAEELLIITEMSQIDIPKELQTSTSSLTIPEELCIKANVYKEWGTSVSTQTITLETQTISTETELTTITSIATQTEESLEKEFVTSSNLKTSSEIQKNIVGITHQPSQLKSHLLLISSSVPEDDNSTSLPSPIIEPDISLEEFTELQISVGTQTECSSPFPQAMVSPMRQFQFSVPTIFPPGSLLSRSSPMRTLLMPLGRRHSPSPARLTPEPSVEKDEGISDEEDPAELRILLELNEQEAAVLRRKVEELESEGENMKHKLKELQNKLTEKTARKNLVASLGSSEPVAGSALHEQKLKVLEAEVSEVRMKLIEKERDCERLHAELTVTQKRFSKGSIQKSKSLDSGNEQQALDLKCQLQVIEQEATILRTNIQTLESDNEKLVAENKQLHLMRLKKGSTEKESEVELKGKLTSLETELAEAYNKVKELEVKLKEDETTKTAAEDKKKKSGAKDTVEVTRLKKEMKTKIEELDKLKAQTKKFEEDNENLTQVLKRLKYEVLSSAAKFYKQRTPKKPTDLTSKVQLKKMVEELEAEIGEVLVLLKKSEMEKSKLQERRGATEEKLWKEEKEKFQKKLDEKNKEVEELQKSLKEEKEISDREKKKAIKDKKAVEDEIRKAEEECSKLQAERKVWDDERKKLEENKKVAEEEIRRAREEAKKLSEDRKRLEEEIIRINAEKVAITKKQEEVSVFVQRIESLKTELEIEQQQGASLRQKLESATIVEQEKIKLQREIMEKAKKVTEAEKKVKEFEEKLKRNEKLLSNNKTKISRLEKEEISVKEEKEKALTANTRVGSAENKEIKSLREQLAASKTQVQELTAKLEKVEKLLKAAEENLKTETEAKKSMADLESKISALEVNLQAEKKKCERMKISQEKELKNREQELSSLRTKLRSLEGNNGTSNKKVTELKEEYQSHIDKLEEALSAERQAYEDLTAKYEILEEEHVVTKAQLVMDKEAIQGQLLTMKRELVGAENELRMLQETYNEKQDSWIKEKLDLQDKLKELEEKVSRSNSNDSWVLERTRLKSALQGKSLEMEQMKKEADMTADQMEHFRRENDELRKKLEDFDKVVKVHRSMSADTSAIEKELQSIKNKRYEEEKTHKSEMAQLKLRYDGRVAVICEEIQGLQGQVSRFKRERDTFRHMLEGAQRTIADLKASSGRESRSSGSNVDESEETQTRIQTLEQQVNCMEDELSEARLEASKLKTELISERSAWEVKLSEMQSHVNELEEDRIISSGRTKIPGMRTRMELAWQKEREEQHRLLQETSTLARDLRQTLFEVERERDKERLEAKRRLEQLKKSTEEEQEENRKKVTELQCDLLELRDAHAKLRTTNEKLRREKERNEKEREELRQLASGRRRAEQDEDRRVNILLEQVDELMRLAPELFLQKSTSDSSSTSSQSQPTPIAPKRLKGPKSRESSRESSPQLQRKEFQKESSVDRKIQLQSTVHRLSEVTEELRRFQRLSEEERDRERAKRMLGLRRAASTESDNPPDSSLRSKPLARSAAALQKKGSLYRKSLSLEQTSGQDQSFWKGESDNEGSLSSLQSLEAGAEALSDNRYHTLQKKESNLDSRLSGGSAQSDVLQSTEKKKKKGFLGKLKKLTKSRSIDDGVSDFTTGMSQGGSGSDISVSEDKGRMKDRITGIFKKSGSTSRSSSIERNPAVPDRSDSTQRPLVRQSSSNTLPRPSPARSDVSASSNSRPLASSSLRSPTPDTSSTPSRGRK
ncbi:golgin subfamily B member 1 isoform X3 [Zootermopsis nevadensis]|uniref:golgin subfamily B member 1 isoform X3 n=1 Tax=Zootermopsis nevadensis TaxID=136037 RepID=UPI000B8EB1FE|nr:golgin subfamily B member 1 isoform X3 [Zootermopsis nevadensis]